MSHDDTTNRQRDVKISDMLGATSLNSSDLVTVVQNGTNYKMTVSEFIAQLGVTGTIVQDGAATGTPVLDPQGAVNNIRNVEDGPGIQSSVSAENGLTIEHNFTQDLVGSPVLVDPTAESPAIASLEAGNGISIVSVDNHIEISATGVTTSSKTIVVNELSDLPTPVAGVITLQDDREYLFVSDVDLGTNRLVMNNTAIRGSESTLITLTYTGTGDMITMADKTCRVSNITLACSSGRIFNWTSTTTGNIFRCNDVSFTCASLGLFDSTSDGILRFTNVSGSCSVTGLVLTGDYTSFLWEVSAFTVNAGDAFDIGTATFDSFIVSTILMTLASGSFMVNGTTAGGNITATGTGTLINCRFFGAGASTPLNGVTPGDPKWTMRANDGLSDTFAENGLFQGDLTIDNAESTGIKVDPSNPDFGWHDLRGRIVFADSGTTRPPLVTFLGSQRYRQFDTTGRRWQLTYHIPHDYVKGTDIYFHIHWAHNSATITTGAANFQAIATHAKGHNQEPFGAEVTRTFGENASLVQYQHMVTETQISVSGGSATQLDTADLEPDSEILIDLRLSSNTMDGGAIPFFLDADIHYQSNSVATKNRSPNFYT